MLSHHLGAFPDLSRKPCLLSSLGVRLQFHERYARLVEQSVIGSKRTAVTLRVQFDCVVSLLAAHYLSLTLEQLNFRCAYECVLVRLAVDPSAKAPNGRVFVRLSLDSIVCYAVAAGACSLQVCRSFFRYGKSLYGGTSLSHTDGPDTGLFTFYYFYKYGSLIYKKTKFSSENSPLWK